MWHKTGNQRSALQGFIGGLLICILVSGCTGLDNRQPPPDLSLTQVVQRINANNLLIDQLLCKHVNFVVRLRDENGVRRRFDMTGAIRYQRPRNLYLSGIYAGKVAMRAGSNDERYWVGVEPRENSLWWGRWTNVNKDCSDKLPIEPDKLIEALGVGLTKLPDESFVGPALERREDANVLKYMAFDPDLQQFYFAKEVHLQRREPFGIEQIVYYDADAHVKLRIKLSRHRPIGQDGPWLARQIELTWPQDESSFRADLHWVRKDLPTPDEAFEFPDTTPYNHVYQVDADCP